MLTMMFMPHTLGCYRPAIICDQCGHEITNRQEGLAHWRDTPQPETNTCVYFTHDGDCAGRWEAMHPDRPGQEWCVAPLDLITTYLGEHLYMDQQRAKQQSKVYFTPTKWTRSHA
jgi:hypothetical protein